MTETFNKYRTPCPGRCVPHPTKQHLTDADVLEIRRLHNKNGAKLRELADKYSTTLWYIAGICTGRYRKHVKGEERPPINVTHQMSRIPEYKVWKVMRQRCYLKTSKGYPYYGGRGITVCSRWQKFENFIVDMGRRPSNTHSIERINNDGNYEPDNCKWATRSEQGRNRRRSRHLKRRALTVEQVKEIQPMYEAGVSVFWLAELYGVHRDTIRRSVQRMLREL